jgi:hypothetical protein
MRLGPGNDAFIIYILPSFFIDLASLLLLFVSISNTIKVYHTERDGILEDIKLSMSIEGIH